MPQVFEGRLCRRRSPAKEESDRRKGQKSEVLGTVSGSWPRTHLQRPRDSGTVMKQAQPAHRDTGPRRPDNPPGRGAAAMFVL